MGGSYRETVRVNSQSGKGGVAFILENYFDVQLPRELLLELSPLIQKESEVDGGELKPARIWDAFVRELVEVPGPYELIDYEVRSVGGEREYCLARIKVAASEIQIEGEGAGPIDAFVTALASTLNEPINVVEYQEYALNEGSQAKAISILKIADSKGNKCFGVGISPNTTTAAFKSIIAAMNRLWR